jgi:amino acid adenylation domain-containing protein
VVVLPRPESGLIELCAASLVDQLMDPRNPSPEERRAALAALLQKKAARPRTYPLSLDQQRVWYAQQLAPDTPFFNLTAAVRLSGPLDPAVLARCLSEVVRRHEALRTSFATVEGQPVQSVAVPRPVPLPLVELSALDLREREMRRLATAVAQVPLDLASGLLMRAVLVRLDEAGHVLLLNLHHIAVDLWSLGILANELAALYPAFAAGQPSPLPELPLQYKDFAVWQRRGADEETGRHLAYWRRRLDGAVELELPTDRPRPRSRTFHGVSERLAVSAETGAGLRALTRETGASLAMATLAAFQALLARHAGQEDGMIGMSVARRDRPELAGLIGQLSNIMAVRTDLAGEPGFRALLARVRQGLLADLAHQDLSFDRLVAELRPQRDPDRHPLVQVMFVFRAAPGPHRTADGPSFALVDFDTGLARFDLELALGEQAGEVGGVLLYHTDLFHPTTALRLARQYEALLAAAIRDPGCPVLELSLLGEAERHQLLREWNDTALPEAGPGWSVLAWIEAAVARDPEAPAVEHDGETLSFGELDRWANRLAHHLRALGAGPGRHVGLLLERSLHWPVAVLACLRSGAAFVPLDPRYPRERLETVAADAGLALLLTTAGAPDLPGLAGVRTVDLDAEAAALGRLSVERPAWKPSPADAAYLVYTSGSTGVPKGVVAVHGNLGSYAALAGWLGIGPGDAYLHAAALGFAASVRQLLAPLARGARVIVAGADDVADPMALLALARRRRATVLDLVPSYWQSLGEVLDRLAPEARSGLLAGDLRLLLASSEPLPTAVPRRWAGLLPAARFVLLFGHSETSSINAVHPVPLSADGPAPALPATIPLGRPAPGRRIWLLDDRLELVPLGAMGELCIAGEAASRGYWRRPERTAEAFVPDPSSGSPGARLYRTGDLGRLLPDGTLVFAGRRDRQVKVRGQRVEVAEIEAALVQLPGVGRAVVEPRPVGGGDAAAGDRIGLVAYVTPGPGGPPDPAELRRRLGERLPPSMIPAMVVVLAALPLTPTGKLDRAALPAPDLASGEADHPPPRTPIETRMAELWAEVLGRPRVGTGDGFFELGGHSLLAVLLLARVREVFGVDLGLRAFLAEATVAASAAAVEEALLAAADPGELERVMAEVESLAGSAVLAELGSLS